MRYVLVAEVWRNGAVCREIFDPKAVQPIPLPLILTVDDMESFTHTYLSEAEAIADSEAFQKHLGDAPASNFIAKSIAM